MIDLHPDTDTLQRDVLAGLSANPKTLPCKYFYDAVGAELFERICELDEYYPTRTELAIMDASLPDISQTIGPHAVVIEPGSGAGIKTRKLLEALEQPNAYVPVDISREQLREQSARLTADMPALTVQPVCADFTADLPTADQLPAGRPLIYFPGSTIGNFGPEAASQLLQRFASLGGPTAKLLLGVDLRKDPKILEAAYNDRQGITAQFNLNLLARINRELNADFVVDQFTHRAVWDDTVGAIRMLLISDQEQTVRVGDTAFHFNKQEAICTELSHKYTEYGFAFLARSAGWEEVEHWTDARNWFGIFLFKKM